MRGVTFENVTGSAKIGFYAQNLDGIELRNVEVTAAEGQPFEWINVKNRVIAPEAETRRGSPARH